MLKSPPSALRIMGAGRVAARVVLPAPNPPLNAHPASNDASGLALLAADTDVVADLARLGNVIADYDWRNLARQTTDVYAEARANQGIGPDDSQHHRADARNALVPPRFDSPPGRLLDVPQ